MLNTITSTDSWEVDLNELEGRMWVDIERLISKANANQGGWIKRAEEIARILGR